MPYASLPVLKKYQEASSRTSLSKKKKKKLKNDKTKILKFLNPHLKGLISAIVWQLFLVSWYCAEAGWFICCQGLGNLSLNSQVLDKLRVQFTYTLV